VEGADRHDQSRACVRRPRRWLVPDLAHVRRAQTGTGKTTAHTDTYHGRFVELVTNEQVVELVEFETTNPALREMTITTTLVDADGGTDVLVVYEGLPRGVPTADNETGTRMALAKLAALVEAG
jgi:Activator of Hsp90 ATPase homolog 1-like protein